MSSSPSSSPSFSNPDWRNRPTDTLACGNRRSDHDSLGRCDHCDVCLKPVCPMQVGAEEFEGLAYHSDCLFNDRQKAVLVAIQALIEAAAEMRKVDEEALILPSDPSKVDQTQAGDAIEELRDWATRNAGYIQAVTR